MGIITETIYKYTDMKLINTVSESVVPCLWMSYEPTAREIYPSSANPVIWKVNLPIHQIYLLAHE